MSSTPQQAPKGPRRSGKKNKTQHIQNDTLRSAVSDNEVTIIQNQNNVSNGKGRRKSQAANKAHTSGNVSDNPVPSKTQATPIKSAYAGPTFHHSPAASALPIPSFYSKSVPAKPAPILEDNAENDEIPPSDLGTPTKRESTPLDFLFDVARQGGTPRGESPGTRSIPARSPAGRSPAPREGDNMFPFELDGATTPGEDGTPFAPSYRDRMNSAKSTRSTSAGVRDMDEDERRAKTDALKKLLYSPSPTPPAHDPNNPFNARAAPSRPYTAHSGSPYPTPGPPNQHQYPTYPRPSSRDQPFSPNPPHVRPQSHLRYEAASSEPEPAELSSDGAALTPPRVSTARREGNYSAPPMQQVIREIPPWNGHHQAHHGAPGPAMPGSGIGPGPPWNAPKHGSQPPHPQQPPYRTGEGNWPPHGLQHQQPQHHVNGFQQQLQRQPHPQTYQQLYPHAGIQTAGLSVVSPTQHGDQQMAMKLGSAGSGNIGGGGVNGGRNEKPTARQMEDQLRSVLNMGGMSLGT